VATDSARATRYAELGYRKVLPTLWRIVDMATGAEIGPHYRTKAELLADLARYAKDFGCQEAGL
jgi:hypothetical protein